jgi:hypothetical protein
MRYTLCAHCTALLYTDYSTDWMGGGERGEGCHPSDLLCWLTVIWSGAPTDSLGGAPTVSITGTAEEASSGLRTIPYEGLEVFYLCLDRI